MTEIVRVEVGTAPSVVLALLVIGCAGPSFEEDVMIPELFRVALPVSDIDGAGRFYERVLGVPGERIWSNRHYFHCGATILACVDPRLEGDRGGVTPNPDHLYFAVDDLEGVFARCRDAGCNRLDGRIETRPWGERSFYAEDPFGNKICFVDRTTMFMGRREVEPPGSDTERHRTPGQ